MVVHREKGWMNERSVEKRDDVQLRSQPGALFRERELNKRLLRIIKFSLV